MQTYVLDAGEPFGDVSLSVEDGKLVEIFLGAERVAARVAPREWAVALRDHLLGRGSFPVELDFTGLAPFRAQAMRAAMEIPAGTTMTYGELAARAGRPKAARAAGSAMARNPFPLLVPCHRVVPKSGGLGQYGAGEGTKTKGRILAWERSAVLGDDQGL